jgi:hypothetical protein
MRFLGLASPGYLVKHVGADSARVLLQAGDAAMSQEFILPKGPRNLTKIVHFLEALSESFAWDVAVKRRVRTRSSMQNAYLWGVVYASILKHLPGWDAEDVHEYFLGECFGWEVIEGFGRKRMRPVRRSSKLSTMEFQDYIAYIQQKMAERGVYIADPNEWEQAA